LRGSSRSSARLTTSRRCSISPARHHSADIRPDIVVNFVVYTCSLILVLHSAWPCSLNAAASCTCTRGLPKIKRRLHCIYSCMSCKTSYVGCPGVYLPSDQSWMNLR
jgi:hypothetical protein